MSQPEYIYTFSFTAEEHPLCQLEMRAFFGCDTSLHSLKSNKEVDPSRSPFMNERIEVMFQEGTVDDMINSVTSIPRSDETFKLTFVQNSDEKKVPFKQAKNIERIVGMEIGDNADLVNPDRNYGIIFSDGEWCFGPMVKGESVWTRHQDKPHQYSTALSTRIARSIVNIAVPQIENVTVIDPCCGIGTVLLEAKSMGITIGGSDINPKVMYGSRKNLAHFGYESNVELKDIREISKHYDVAIIDMPYNLCSVLEPEDQFEMLVSARNFASKVVVVTIEPIDEAVIQAGFEIADRCVFKKNGRFKREVLVCK
ncbi:RNA methyltransferase [Bacillus sp. H-16]|uniref:TRM11 family SAM-dependent methyltransferase n=1 Tax=Alteribacter salitolerans TaxID=2912333 RepID=UPI0019645295|nr:RNA methyltransferase [Alteribacter salitolerans]MBM7094427.1 RNA methyltransferase [Alteribacter salitolerans]